jgi:hypothetical protein
MTGKTAWRLLGFYTDCNAPKNNYNQCNSNGNGNNKNNNNNNNKNNQNNNNNNQQAACQRCTYHEVFAWYLACFHCRVIANLCFSIVSSRLAMGRLH